MFEKNLTDLVRGIRNNKSNEAKYIASCLDEIKQELRQENAAVKANAVAKLTYLQMLGYDISWAAFNIIEVMSSSKFTFKRIGYLAASQSFHEELDILMLTTNMIRKDLCSMNVYDAGVSLAGFSCFVTTDLARDLANDVMCLLVSTKPYIRKRAVLLMYKIFLKFPEALRPAFPRLKEKLEDSEPGVQSAAVNVICELARKNPKNYLSLAPLFFKLMTNSTNNWMLIKIIKLFGALCPLEPRLGKKLLEPLTNLIHSTSAMSLLYECINTVVSGLPHHTASIQLCVSKLRILIEDPDQNLKYLGLLAMSKILAVNPKVVQGHKDIVLQCLDDKDESIRLRALDLIVGMVSKKNIMDITKKLMVQIDKADSQTYCDELLSKIVQICSLNDYHYVTNFEWYIDVLVQLTRVEGTRHGKLIASQMMDVTIRVKAIRPYAVQCLSLLLTSNELMSGQMEKNRVCEVLFAAAWISGEFSEHLPDINVTLEAMLQPKATSLPGHIQAVYVQNIAKLYAKLLANQEEDEDGDTKSVSEMLVEKLPIFVQSADLEVQERASCILQLIKYVLKLQGKGVDCSEEVSSLFRGELNPVASKAQKKVQVPEGLDLDKWINEPPSESSEDEQDIETIFDPHGEHKELKQKHESEDEEEMKKRREQRKQDQLSNPHYLKVTAKEDLKAKKKEMLVDDIPVANLDLPVSLKVSGGLSLDKKYASRKAKKKRKKGRKGSRADEEEPDRGISYEVLPAGAGEMPEGAAESDHDDKENEDSFDAAADPHKLLNVDLSKPLEAHEALPVRQHRTVTEKQPTDTIENEEEPKSKKHGKDKKHRHRKDSEGKKGKHKHRKDKDEKDKKTKHKHHHHKEEEPAAPEENLMFNGEVEHPESPTDEVEKGDEGTTPSKAATKLQDSKPVIETPSDPQDDMDFWLSPTPEKKSQSKLVETPTSSSPEKSPKQETHAKQSEKTESKESKRKHRKDKSDKKEKHEKERKKEKRKRRSSEKSDTAEVPVAEPDKQDEPSMMELNEGKKQPIITTYKVLAENSALRLMYETRVTSQNRNQVVVSIIFSNLTDRHIKSMEFNVLDSLNTKLIRPIGSSSHDSVPVPFHLLPGCSNEGQFAFTVESIVMAQKLRGTLTYVIKDDEGSTSEKMDFSLFLPCSSFLISTPLSSTDFASLLGSGTLVNKSSVKVTAPETTEFSSIISKICILLHFAVVEQVDSSASLYASSIQNHHLCLLVKQLPDNSVSVDGKSTDASMVSNVLDEIKLLLQTP
ncbi:AP-3 complex subunit delta-1-like isoform X2 [Porites lutea]|uniref:AP-3 complex subunit delta-1-like isoform X2 n=1 Tax=Porites lutea TaxID=51062 RepID=UPI003CC5A21F